MECYRLIHLKMDAAKHPEVTDLKGQTHSNPYSKNINDYVEQYKYFCTLLQQALIKGKWVYLPGIGKLSIIKRTTGVSAKLDLNKRLETELEKI